jgi:alpha-L-arabinofuranosidase
VGTFEIPRAPFTLDTPLYKILRYAFDWNAEALPLLGRDMTYYSLHHYDPQDAVQGASVDVINRSVMVKAEDLSKKLDRLYAQMEQVAPAGNRFPIALDEWAPWLPKDLPPEASPKPPEGVTDPKELGRYGSLLTLRDALAEAAVYNLMQRRPRDFALASRTIRWAYGVGLIGTGQDRVAASPSALMLELYATHENCEALRVEVAGPTFDAPSKGLFTGAQGANYLDASARRCPGRGALELFVVHRHLKAGMEATIRFAGASMQGPAAVNTLTADSLVEWNSFEKPERVSVTSSSTRVEEGSIRHRFPARSVVKFLIPGINESHHRGNSTLGSAIMGTRE